MPPHVIGHNAFVQNSMISEGCNVDGKIDFSVLFTGVTVEKDAVVRDSILMPGSVIRSGAVIEYAIIAENVEVQSGAKIGCRPEDIENLDDWGVAVVGEGVTISGSEVIPPKSMIENETREGK